MSTSWGRILGVGLAVAFLAACNLNFDSSAYDYVEPVDLGSDAGTDEGSDTPDVDDDVDPNTLPGCVDNDNDNFGVGADCVKDQRDCDDTKAFVNPNAAEECDNLDNDCDGMIDEDADGEPLSRECYTGARVQLERTATACMPGRVVCEDGRYPSPVTPELCIGQVLPAANEDELPEKCDGLDNDCDGSVDPRCPCPEEGRREPCYDAAPETRGKGTCREGERECFRLDSGELEWGACEGAVGPVPEACDNMDEDNDCNDVTDDVAFVGEPCDTGEFGRCMAGELDCVDSEQVCVRTLSPLEEVCNDLDLDCDGDPRNGVANACGGCIPLDEVPDEVCGICNDGRWACDGPDEIACLGASTLNACGECGQLDNQPQTDCGVCGEYECNQEGEGTFCNDPGLNACDACGPIRDGELLGSDCGECGTFECNEDGDGVVCRELPPNDCNGCAELEGEPGEQCGVCARGTYTCDGENAVQCVGDPGQNACGGCADLGGVPGVGCGECGTIRCDENDNDRVFCDDPGQNLCGGCETLLNEPGSECGTCGTYVCQNGTTVCDDPGQNSCGGCAILPGTAGERCQECGVWTCVGEEAMVCNDPGFNSCGGCGELEAEPLSECGVCGEYKCSLDLTRVLCDDPGINECGFCGEIQGEPLGEDCGVCGTYECGDGNETACVDPGLNACLGCGELDNQPGEPCGLNDCGSYICDENGGVTCHMNRCPTQPSGFRFFTAVEGPTTDWAIDGQTFLTDREAVTGTIYLRANAGAHTFSVYEAGMNQIPEALLFDYAFSLAANENRTLIWAGASDGDYGTDDIYEIIDDNTPIAGRVKLRWFNGMHGVMPDGAVQVEFRLDGQVVAFLPRVEFGEASDYLDLAPGVYEISAQPVGGGFPVGTFTNPAFNTWLGGEVRTLVHAGSVGGLNSGLFLTDSEERYFP